MSGRKFFKMLRYLHCCSMDNLPVGDDYDPTYKVKEMKEYLEDWYQQLFIPGQQLSLHATLIRAFGRIKFKARIVTKAARYSIKLYVITDAVTTIYKCLACGVPLCSIGSGKVDDDCFAIAHESLERRELVCKKFVAMQKRTTIKNKLET
jgi:Transposase IS4